ncbi:MAG: hypothetical protein GY750_15415 [Lentisphaerae bacterium]|nr:hypothetical protein [Lentisphaerota bacterium]MCP4102787.1 hypothetical protein [Lentisphaerota bacterium]
MITFKKRNPRIFRKNAFVLEDTAFNLWVKSKDSRFDIYVDGKVVGKGTKFSYRNLRNSSFRYGRLALGNRHIVEIGGKKSYLRGVDSKVCPNRYFISIDSKQWQLNGLKTKSFDSKIGAPYGDKEVVLPAGSSMAIDVVGTDISVAYADSRQGGDLKVAVDSKERLCVNTNVSFKFINGEKQYMENRKGIIG